MKRNESSDDRTTGIFEPDTLLPSQFADRTGVRRVFDGERRLMVAILEDAIDVYRKQAAACETRKRHMFEDAERWIEDRDVTWIFSFENICAVLDLDADYIRRGLHAWRDRVRATPASAVVSLRPPAEAADPDELRRASGEG